ncbi:MAG: SCO family protein [Alphaproteobacteria bacterium]|nr:SCO family protein [Alphaproteobacteria bacterium]
MRSFLLSAVIVVLGAIGLWQTTDGLRALTAESARRLEVATGKPALPALSLEDMAGRSLTLGRPGDKLTLAEFIYTSCPTICRAAGESMAMLRDRLAADGIGDRVRLLSVSFDPLQDDLEALADYGEWHGAAGEIWTVARPSLTDLDVMLASFGVQVIPDGFGGFEHNAALHMIDRDGHLIGIFDIDDIDGAVRAIEAKL